MIKDYNIKYFCDSKNISKLHYHNDFEIIYVTKGSSVFEINDRNFFLETNSLILISELESHTMNIKSFPYERFVLYINKENLYKYLPSDVYNKIFQKRPIDFPYIFKFDKKVSNFINEIFYNLLGENKNKKFTQELSDLLISQLMILIYRSNLNYFNKEITELDNIIISIQNYINKYYYKQITLSFLEKKFFLSKYTISRSFKDITGYNFKTYLILIRLSAAKNLLVKSDTSVKNIAYKIGYDSENLFIRMFKKYEKLTPTEYRNLFNQKNNNY